MGPSKRLTSQGISGGTLKNWKLPPIELCERYIESYLNDKGRSARDIYFHVRDEVSRTRKRYGA